MPVRDEDPASLVPPGEITPDIPLDAARTMLQQLLRDLVEINTGLSATLLFLHRRGLTSTVQLDEQGKRELVSHLEETLRNAYRAGRIF